MITAYIPTKGNSLQMAGCWESQFFAPVAKPKTRSLKPLQVPATVVKKKWLCSYCHCLLLKISIEYFNPQCEKNTTVFLMEINIHGLVFFFSLPSDPQKETRFRVHFANRAAFATKGLWGVDVQLAGVAFQRESAAFLTAPRSLCVCFFPVK